MERRLKTFFIVLYVVSGIGFVLSLFSDRILPINASLLGIIRLVLGIILIVPAVISFVRWQGIRRYRTPYDAIRKRLRKSTRGRGSKEKPYDFFISYKSEDAMRIRPLVEQMLASGLNVWFAEYNITLNSWDAFEREIEAGITNANYGLCFTNKNYIESLYCIAELDQLLAPRNCGPRHVIEIQFPPHSLPHERYPQLKTIPVIQYRDDPNALITQINQMTGRSILSSLPAYPESPGYRSFEYGGQPYQLDLAGWTLLSAGSSMKPGGEADGPFITRICGEHEVRGYLHIGTQIAFPRAHTSTDDRANYKYGIEFAKVHFAILPLQCIGVHLFFFHGESNIALTARGLTGWCRTYSVITRMPGIGYVEFLFDFFMRSPFTDFCRYAHQMERVVQSLRWNRL